MGIEIIKEENGSIIVKIDINDKDTFLETEEIIMSEVNEVGRILTRKSLENINPKEDKIERNEQELVLKNNQKKKIETPYGEIEVERNIYKSTLNNKTYCPMDEKAKIIRTSTPRLAKMITSKYTRLPAGEVRDDLTENHGLTLAESYIQNLTYTVEVLHNKITEKIEYELPNIDEEIATVALGMDGTCSYIGNEGWRETMVGTLSLHNENGDRLHTIYVSNPPEYGKATFKEEMMNEIEKIKKVVPRTARFIGVADGAADNWKFLDPFIECEIVDFFHVSEYLAKASKVINFENKNKEKEWLDNACHSLKNEENAALILLKEMEALEIKPEIPKKAKENFKATITYFNNHYHQMDYQEAIKNNYPIGSGVTESACKILVKQRLCISGARWSNRGANSILKLRAVNLTNGRWKQLWNELVS